MSESDLYRGEWRIEPAYIGFQWSHVDYDGPEDRRIGSGSTVEECERAIDDWLIEHLDGINCELMVELSEIKQEVADIRITSIELSEELDKLRKLSLELSHKLQHATRLLAEKDYPVDP